MDTQRLRQGRLTREIPTRGGSDIRALFRKLKKAGCWWEPAASGHWKVYDAGLNYIGTAPGVAGDVRGLKNLRSDLGKAGVSI
jgi:hypothetical protein